MGIRLGKPKRKIWLWLVLILILAAAALGIFLAAKGGGEPVSVFPFQYVGMTEYWGDNQESYGPVRTDKIQTIFLSDTQSVTEVKVSLGDTVKKGDILMTFDTSLDALALERKRLEVEKLKLDLDSAKRELEDVWAMEPYEPTEYEEPEPTEPDYGTKLKETYKIHLTKEHDGTAEEKAVILWLQDDENITNDILVKLWTEIIGEDPEPEPTETEPSETEESKEPSDGENEGTENEGGESAGGNTGSEDDEGEDNNTGNEDDNSEDNGSDSEDNKAEDDNSGNEDNKAEDDNSSNEDNKAEDDNSDNENDNSEDDNSGNEGGAGENSNAGNEDDNAEDDNSENEDDKTEDENSSNEDNEAENNNSGNEDEDSSTDNEDDNTENNNSGNEDDNAEGVANESDGGGDVSGENTPQDNTNELQPSSASGLPVIIQLPGARPKQVFVVFKITEDNMSKGALLFWQGIRITKDSQGNFSFRFFDASAMEDYTLPKEEEKPIEIPEIDFGSGYTVQQLAQMRNQLAKQIKELEFNVRMAEAEYKLMQIEISDGNVYAELDGEIVSVLTEEEAKMQRQPLIKLSGGGGFFVEGSVNELEKDKLQPGQEVTINDWNTGSTYTGEVREIGDFPSSDDGWNGMGNPNATYYPFTVFVGGEADLQAGSYVSVMYSTSGTENGIYLENAFIREEQGANYVMVRGADGKLEKRTVTVGKSLWGSYQEILSGITEEDLIAFPYGKDVKIGAATVESDLSALYGY